MSEVTAVLPLAVPSREARALHISRRTIKIAIAVTMLATGSYGIFSESEYVSSSNSVVSAYVLEVRSPIDGTVDGLPLAAGMFIQQDQFLARLNNTQASRQNVGAIQTLEDEGQATAVALAAERDALVGQREALLARAGEHISAVGARLSQQAAEAERVLSAREIALRQANVELGRSRQLHDAGVVSNAEFDKLVFAQQIAVEQVAAQQAEVSSARAQVRAASHGTLSEAGAGGDVSYSRQRADEISMRLVEISGRLAASRVREETGLAREVSNATALRQSELRSPISGLVWKLQSINGERAATGDTILSLIDCNRQFLLAEIPQDRLPDVALGRRAQFRLSGESFDRGGTVLSVSGDPQRQSSADPDQKLAAFPVRDSTQQLATVLIGMDAAARAGSAQGCLVGRTARVLIPTNASNVASRWMREMF